MASEASRSTGAADSYIGSLISLTSKSEIRYEGVLFNINTDEASIGLRNVQSFGTEGRRKDGPQVPASDKVYEYIVFRGSDIRDLQVKSSPPVQTVPPVHNDPAVIQSHYATPVQPSSMPTASATATATAAGSLPDLSSQMPQPGLPRSTYPSNVPLYQPGGGLASWSPNLPPTSASNLQVPMYWPGYYGPSGVLQTQQSLLRPMQGMSVPPSLQPPAQYPTMPPSLPAGTSSLPASQTMGFSPQLLQPIADSTMGFPSTVPPVQPSAQVADLSSNVMPSKIPAVSQSSNSLLLTPTLSNVSDKGPVVSLDQTKPISNSLPFNHLSESLSTLGGTSNAPMLVTPGQFLQPGSSMSQTSQTAQKDVEVVQGSSVALQPQASVAAAAATATMSMTTATASVPEAQPPLLPLPSSSNSKINGASSYSHNVNPGGRGRGRRNEFATPVNYTEDFDFEAMNEKFKKDEVWGHLGKTKANVNDGLDLEVEPEIDQNNSNPVYKKDDFFDTLSCNALDHESRNGRPRFSEQMRLDTETFGDFARNRGYRGGRGYGRGGRSRGGGGGYYGRGYGYVGRGRGHNNMYRAM